MNGFMGKLLFIDLSSGKIEERPLDETVAKNFLGGYGLGAKILYEEMPAHADPFSEESMIGFLPGAVTGTGTLMAGRYTVVSKSPVTNGWNDANSGGMFGQAVKKAGYDGIFVKGISPKPVYIFVDDGKTEIRDASALWGKTVLETEKIIRAEIGDDKVYISQTGPSGEKKSLIAAVMNDGHRAAGRGGSGAVMGSKNLKAIAVRGSKTPSVADKQAQIAVHKELTEWQKNGPTKDVVSGFKDYGTTALYEVAIMSGDSNVRNWTGYGGIDLTDEQRKGPFTQEKYKRGKYACATCNIGCGAVFELKGGGVDTEHAGRPEYETMGCFGGQLMNGDPLVINVCNHLCNEYGLDTISAGATVAWAMECYNNGILSLEELDGIDLKWGNGDAIIKMTEKLCKGEGVGAILQKGSRGAAEHFGKGHSALVDASGIELPQHDPRYAPGLARTYLYDPTPGRHVKGGLTPGQGREPAEVKYSYEDTKERDVDGVIFQEILNVGGFCQFTDFGYGPGAHIAMINAVTGFNYSEEERRKLGLRIFVMRHAFNLREGFRRGDWSLSERAIGSPPLKEGPLAGVTVDVKKLSDNFFEHIGFDMDSVPLRATLEEIGGLEQVIKDIYPE